MKNIGIIVDNEFNSDIRVRKEIEILIQSGHSIHVLCFAFDNKEYPTIEGINIERIKIKKRVKDALFLVFNRIPIYETLWKKRIQKFIHKNRIDILHAHDLYMAKATYLGAKNENLPIILDLHENFPYAIQLYNWTKGNIRNTLIQPKKWLKKEKEYLGYASKLIVLSESFKQDLLSRYSFLKNENIIAFPNVIDLRRFEQFKIDSTVGRSDKTTLMYFGGVAERRGVFNTIAVLKDALKINPAIKLLIIGPLDKADKNRFYTEINQAEVKNNIEYIPWIDISALVTYMNNSDIFLSPLAKNEQHESGVANKIYQYMFGKKPIIVSDCKPQKELITSFNCGLSYSTQEEYLACIIKLVENKSLREELGVNGYKNLYKTYDNKNYESILVKLYQSVTK